MSRYERAWAVWSVVAGISFLVIELLALFRRKNGEGTFSHFFRRICGIKPSRPYKRLSIAAFAAFMLWFFVHIVTGKV